LFTNNLYGDPSLIRERTASISIRGDVNADRVIDSRDVVYLRNYLYKNSSTPDPLWTGDANCDENVDVGDVIFLLTISLKED